LLFRLYLTKLFSKVCTQKYIYKSILVDFLTVIFPCNHVSILDNSFLLKYDRIVTVATKITDYYRHFFSSISLIAHKFLDCTKYITRIKWNLCFNYCKGHEATLLFRKKLLKSTKWVDCTDQHCETQIGNFIIHREGLSLLLQRRSLLAS